MIRDEKAIRAAELVRQYCRERSCYACIFRTVSGVCLIGDTRVPENWQLNGLKQEGKDDGRRDQGARG